MTGSSWYVFLRALTLALETRRVRREQLFDIDQRCVARSRAGIAHSKKLLAMKVCTVADVAGYTDAPRAARSRRAAKAVTILTAVQADWWWPYVLFV